MKFNTRKTLQYFFSKKRLIYVLLIVFSSLATGVALATPPLSPYAPGETLAPTCAPGDPLCTVTTPFVASGSDEGNSIFLEGTTIDANEIELTTLSAVSTADRTINFQDASGTVAFLADIPGGGGPLATPYVDFQTGLANPAYTEGRVFWDDTLKTLSYFNDVSGITMNLGQENWIRAKNITGSTILNGSVVYINGVDGGITTIALAQADALTTSQAVGIATHDILTGTIGYVTNIGVVHDIDTQGLAEGEDIFLSATTAGGFTDNRPAYPNFVVPLGVIAKAQSGVGVLDGDVLAEIMSHTREGSFTTGSVTFADSSGLDAEDNANFFWDNTNKFLGIGTNTPTGALTVGSGNEFAVDYSGNTSMDGSLTVAGNLNTPKGADYPTTGVQNDVNLGIGSLFRYTGGGTATFNGLTGGADGRTIVLMNTSASNLTIANQSLLNPTPANRIITANGADITVAPDVSVTFQYDSVTSRWRLVSLTASALLNIAFLQDGNSFGTTGTLGTNDANALAFETSGTTRFTLAFGASTLTGAGATTFTSTGATTLSSAAGSALNVTSGTTGVLTLDSGTSGTVNLGTGATAKTINIGTGAGGDTINIGTNNTIADTITIGSSLDSVSIASSGLTFTAAGNITSSASANFTPGTAADFFNILSGNLKVGNGTPDLTLNGEDAYVEGTFEVDGSARFDGASNFNGVSTFNTDTDLTFAGTENLSATSDLAGTVNVLSLIGTPSGTAGTTGGLFIQQADSANTNGLDSAISIDNADTDLAISSALSITNSGGGNYTKLLDTPTLDISGAGVISGATGFTSTGGAGSFTLSNAAFFGCGKLNTDGSGNILCGVDATGGAGGTLQDAYDNGAIIATTGADIAFTLNGDDFNIIDGVGASAVNLNPDSASTFTSSGGSLTFTAGAASTWGTSAGDLTLQVAGAGTGTVKIGTGGAGSVTPDILALDVKSTTGDPAGFNGAIYYNEFDDQFRCYTNGSWGNCDTTGGTTTLQTAYDAGETISVTSGQGPLTITGASANVDFVIGSGADTGDFRIWDGTDNWMFVDESADILAIGAAAGGGITIGGTGITTTNAGALTVTQTLTANGDTTIGNAVTDNLTVASAIQGTNALIFDGSTDDINETTFAITNPTGDNTITFKDASGTVAFISDLVTANLTDNVTDAYDLQEGTNNYININTTNSAENISFGNATTNPSYSFLGTGTSTMSGGLAINGATSVNGNLATPAGADYVTTGVQNDVNLGIGSLFRYEGGGTATFTGFTGGTDGRQFRLINASASNLFITNQDAGSTAANRVITSTGATVVVSPEIAVSFQYDSNAAGVGDGRWRLIGIPATSLATTVFLQDGNSFGTTGTLGTNDANALAFETSGITRFTVAAGAATLTGTGATTLAGGSTLDLSSATASALTVTSGTTGALTLDSGTSGTVNLGTGATAKTINIGTATVANTITIGSSSATGVSITDDNWSISTAGLITTANDIAVNGADITSTATTLRINAGGNVDIQDATNVDNLTTDTGGVSIAAGQSYTGSGAVTLSSATTNALTLDAGTSGALNLNNTSTGDILIGGGSGSTGCTITNSTGALACSGAITGSNTSGTNTGDVILTAIGAVPNANGASLSGQVLNLQPADASFGGVVTTGVQTLAGAKTFSSLLTGSAGLTVTGNWTGNVVTTSTTDSATTSTISTTALAYYVESTDTTGSCVTATKIFNITGLSNTEGAFAYIVSKATDGGCGPAGTLTLTVQINGTTISTVANANTGGTVTENYTVSFINGAWRILGTPSTADGADLAEMYSTNDENIGAGDVASLDSSLNFGVKKSTGVNDKGVIGIVSTNPGVVIGGTMNEGVTAIPVALSGRVPVKVVTENGSIEPGDYLTSSSTPGVAMKSNGSGPVIGQAMSSYNSEGVGLVMAFIKNFDLGGVGQSVLLGDVSSKVNSDGTDNGLSTLVADIQAENARNPITIITAKITDGKEFLTDFVVARVTAIRGYFDEIFSNTSHQKTLCVGDVDGETCITKTQLDALLQNINIDPTPTCAPPQTLVDNICVDPVDPLVCTPPQTLVDNVCTDPIDPPTCTPPQTLVNNVCVDPTIDPPTCTSPQVLVNNVCTDPVIDPPVCTPPQTLVDNVCTDPTPEPDPAVDPTPPVTP